MQVIAKKLIILETVDSTNNYAMAMIKDGCAISGQGIFAKTQTHGKGRRGKAWKSQAGENIILTITHQMLWLPVQQQFQLSVAVALGCIDFFLKHIEKNIKIKWPNDIYVNDRKAGGVLIENVVKGNLWQWAIIGIGLNINQKSFEDEIKAISLKQITEINYDVVALAKELISAVISRTDQLKCGEFDTMFLEYNENLFFRDKIARLKKNDIVFETTIKEVSPIGELITIDTSERKFNFDEVEWLLL